MIKRNFCIGSEWLYYKIYTGVKTTDFILLEKLYPAIEVLIAEKLIDKWFFIRYKDPDEHIRIRFYNTSSVNIITIINQLYPVLNQLLEDDLVWKIQTETYQRELERYGENTIEDSETLFWHDSEMIVRYLALKPNFATTNTPLLFSFAAIDGFLNSFLLTNTEKLALLTNLQAAFKKEFDADKILKKEMDKSYREIAIQIDLFLKGISPGEDKKLFKLIKEKRQKSKKASTAILKNSQTSLFSFLSSHIHMIINRQYTSRQRMYEAVIYDHLCRYYKTIAYHNVD